jgi:hypothetical protein
MGHELLVRGHDRFAGGQRAAHPARCLVDPAYRLDHDVDVALEDVVDSGGPDDRRVRGQAPALLAGTAIEDVCEDESGTGE